MNYPGITSSLLGSLRELDKALAKELRAMDRRGCFNRIRGYISRTLNGLASRGYRCHYEIGIRAKYFDPSVRVKGARIGGFLRIAKLGEIGSAYDEAGRYFCIYDSEVDELYPCPECGDAFLTTDKVKQSRLKPAIARPIQSMEARIVRVLASPESTRDCSRIMRLLKDFISQKSLGTSTYAIYFQGYLRTPETIPRFGHVSLLHYLDLRRARSIPKHGSAGKPHTRPLTPCPWCKGTGGYRKPRDE